VKLTPEQKQLVLDNMRLVPYIANKFNINRDYEHDEVLGVSYYALVMSALTYDSSYENTTFAGYACRNMKRYLYRQFMYRYITKLTEMEYLEDMALSTDNDDVSNWQEYYGEESPENELIERIWREEIIAMLESTKMGKAQREAIRLKCINPELSQQELADLIGCSQKNVSLAFVKAREKLKPLMAG